jgi:hypothetical protein
MITKLEHAVITACSGSSQRQAGFSLAVPPSSKSIARTSASSSTRSGRIAVARQCSNRRAYPWSGFLISLSIRSYVSSKLSGKSSRIRRTLEWETVLQDFQLAKHPTEPISFFIIRFAYDVRRVLCLRGGHFFRPRVIYHSTITRFLCSAIVRRIKSGEYIAKGIGPSRKLTMERRKQVTQSLLIDIHEIKIKVGHRGTPSITD